MIKNKSWLKLLSCRENNRRYVNTIPSLATAFNSKPDVDSFNIFKKGTGLFGIEKLHEPSGFYLLKENAVFEADKLLAECISPDRKRKLVEVFDQLSNSLCKVADLADFVRMSHPDARFSESARNACLDVGGLVEKLNTNQELYKALKKVVLEGDFFSTTEIDDYVAKLFLFDFEQSGIHLSESDRNKFLHLNESILVLGQRFLQGTNLPRSFPKSKIPPGFSHPFEEDGNNVFVGAMFSDSPSETVREIAYKVFLHPDEAQENILAKLLRSRHEMASLCGFASFSHRATKGSLAESPELVNSFLSKLSEAVKRDVSTELMDLTTLKKRENSCPPLSPWDLTYLSSIARRKILPSNISNPIHQYFSLGSVMQGINDLFSELFDVTFRIEKTLPGELWDDDVYKLAVLQGSTELLGFIYCDFFENSRKSNQDCHFTIKGGKELSNGVYQNPVVVLHLTLPKPTWSSPCLMSLSQVENLFHEIGHGLHSMLARTQYQHVTGTRCCTDFAEVPSILMEYFANDPRVLHRISCHFKSKEKLPFETIEKILAAKNCFAAIEMQLQVFYSILDQRYHDADSLLDHRSTTDILAEVQSEHYCFPYVPNTAWQLRFGHLVGYGAKYYSYLMSRAVASWIYQQYFQENPFCRVAGEKLRKEVLQHGGGKPPQKMIAEYLGKKVSSENLVSALMNDLRNRKENYFKLTSR